MSHTFIDPVSRATSRVSPSSVTAYNAGGAAVSVPVNHNSFPSGRHANPLAPRCQPRAIVTGVFAPTVRTEMSNCPPSRSMNAICFPFGDTRKSRSSCSVS